MELHLAIWEHLGAPKCSILSIWELQMLNIGSHMLSIGPFNPYRVGYIEPFRTPGIPGWPQMLKVAILATLSTWDPMCSDGLISSSISNLNGAQMAIFGHLGASGISYLAI